MSIVAQRQDANSSLERKYQEITRFSSQVPRSSHGESRKATFLRNAVVGNIWATELLSRIATHRRTLQQLCDELEAALHLHKEARLAFLRDSYGHNA